LGSGFSSLEHPVQPLDPVQIAGVEPHQGKGLLLHHGLDEGLVPRQVELEERLLLGEKELLRRQDGVHVVHAQIGEVVQRGVSQLARFLLHRPHHRELLGQFLQKAEEVFLVNDPI